MTVNGERREADVWAGESLLTTLRDRLDLPGSKNACEQGECGSCSVLLDGELVCACLVLAAQADGYEVTTVEGLRSPGGLHAVQQAFVPLDLSLGGRPGMLILVHPERAAGMNEEDLHPSLASAVWKQACARPRH